MMIEIFSSLPIIYVETWIASLTIFYHLETKRSNFDNKVLVDTINYWIKYAKLEIFNSFPAIYSETWITSITMF